MNDSIDLERSLMSGVLYNFDIAKIDIMSITGSFSPKFITSIYNLYDVCSFLICIICIIICLYVCDLTKIQTRKKVTRQKVMYVG